MLTAILLLLMYLRKDSKVSMKTEKTKKIAFLGGDMRSFTAASRFAFENKSWDVFIWKVLQGGENQDICVCDRMCRALEHADAVVLPLPASSDGITLNAKTEENEIKTPLNVIADALDENTVIIGGRLPRAFLGYAESRGIKTFDYFEYEAFQIKNAYTTAEAALNIAMNNLNKNIKGSRAAITGYGRISKQLLRLLKMLGVKVTLLARKDSDLAWASLEGCDVIKLCAGDTKSLMQIAKGYDVIFNTVPSRLFDESFLRSCDKKTLIIDLASAPGGVDISQAKQLRANVLWATSLPGKYAPESAGELICDCISDILRGEGEI